MQNFKRAFVIPQMTAAYSPHVRAYVTTRCQL
jgi:hypothetical protein